MDIGTLLALLSGIFWTIVYVDSIRVGLRDKSYAMPLWALGLNIAWEGMYAVLGYQYSGLTMQTIINGVWFLFDLGLVYTFFRYGKKYFPKVFTTTQFYLWGILGIGAGAVVQVAFLLEFKYGYSAVYSAFLQNLLMSVLFIAMLVQRKSSEGQSMLIAVSKFLGSLAPTISFGLIALGEHPANVLVLIVGLLMALFDLIYIWLLANVKSIFKAGSH